MRGIATSRYRLGFAATVIALVATACGGTSTAQTSGTLDLAPFKTAATAAEQLTTFEGPTSSPPIAKSKTIAVILCAAAAEGCQRIGNGVKDAAAALGWTVKMIDGQGQASIYNSAMLQAVTQKVDGIILIAIDSKDCWGREWQKRKPQTFPSSAWSAATPRDPQMFFAEPNARAVLAGQQLGNWLVVDSGGKAVIAMFHAPEFTDSRRRYDGSKSIFDKCTTCKIVSDTNYVASQAAQQIPLQTKSILQAHPDINYVWIDIGGFGQAQVQAINELGLKAKVKVVSFDCNPPDLANLRAGNVQAACEGLGLEPGGWGGIDELNRAFNSAPSASDFVPIRVVTKKSIPAQDIWRGDFDYAAAYKKLWVSRNTPWTGAAGPSWARGARLASAGLL